MAKKETSVFKPYKPRWSVVAGSVGSHKLELPDLRQKVDAHHDGCHDDA
jgi:hypothetical protein